MKDVFKLQWLESGQVWFFTYYKNNNPIVARMTPQRNTKLPYTVPQKVSQNNRELIFYAKIVYVEFFTPLFWRQKYCTRKGFFTPKSFIYANFVLRFWRKKSPPPPKKNNRCENTRNVPLFLKPCLDFPIGISTVIMVAETLSGKILWCPIMFVWRLGSPLLTIISTFRFCDCTAVRSRQITVPIFGTRFVTYNKTKWS